MLYTSNLLILIIPNTSLGKKEILANLSKTDALLVPVWFVEPFAPCDHPLESQDTNKLFLCVLGALACVFKYAAQSPGIPSYIDGDNTPLSLLI